MFFISSYAESGKKPVKSSQKTKKQEFNTTSTYSRLCNEDDLYGLWKAVRWIPYFEIKGKDWTKPEMLRNQWFEFNGRGGMKYLASNLEIKTDDVRKKLHDAKFDIKISFKTTGFMTVTYPEQKDKKPETWRCSLSFKNITISDMNIKVKKGDIIMTQLGKHNTIRYFRLLRKVKDD